MFCNRLFEMKKSAFQRLEKSQMGDEILYGGDKGLAFTK